MRLGVYLGQQGVAETIDQVRAARQLDLDSVYFSQFSSWDAITVAALCGPQVPGIDLGTAVVPTYSRHPLAMASQALTAQIATGNRFTLGVGPSHREVVEGRFGLSYDQPARHIREYLSALGPLLRGESVDYRGQTLTAVGEVQIPGAEPPSLLVSALGPVMLRIAGELADGTVTVWAGPDVIADHVVPAITRAAAGRAAPRVVVTAMVSVTGDPQGTKEEVRQRMGFAGQFASYRALLGRQGLSGVHDTVVAGDESFVTQAIRRYAEAGATEFLASPVGTAEERTRTLALVASLL